MYHVANVCLWCGVTRALTFVLLGVCGLDLNYRFIFLVDCGFRIVFLSFIGDCSCVILWLSFVGVCDGFFLKCSCQRVRCRHYNVSIKAILCK